MLHNSSVLTVLGKYSVNRNVMQTVSLTIQVMTQCQNRFAQTEKKF